LAVWGKEVVGDRWWEGNRKRINPAADWGERKRRKKKARLGWGKRENGEQCRTTRTRDAMLPHLFTPRRSLFNLRFGSVRWVYGGWARESVYGQRGRRRLN